MVLLPEFTQCLNSQRPTVITSSQFFSLSLLFYLSSARFMNDIGTERVRALSDSTTSIPERVRALSDSTTSIPESQGAQ